MSRETKPPGVGIGTISPRLVEAAWKKFDRSLEHSGVLPDWAVKEFITIDDFIDYDECQAGAISYGLTSAGYDIRVGGIFKVFTNANCETVNPKNLSKDCFIDRDLTGHEWVDNGNSEEQFCFGCGCRKNDKIAMRLRCASPHKDTPLTIKIPPNCFALAETVERLHIPRNVDCWCIGKSTYARCGINMNFTPFEPGWRGIVTVEIINATPLPVEIYAWEGIGQAQFFLMAGEPERAYSDKKNAKYQDQAGLTLPYAK